MGNNQRIRISNDILLLLSMFFILYPDINFGTDSFFSNKPISIWLCLLYIALHLQTATKRIKKNEVFFILMFLISAGIGLILGDRNIGILRQINGYIGVAATYLAVKIYCIKSSNRGRVFKLLKTMLLSYFWLVLITGGLQVIYIYLGHNDLLGTFLTSILYRGYAYFINQGWGRVCFTFTEPSMAGLYFYCFFIPVYMLCKKYHLFKESFLKKTLIICFLMNTLTLSGRWFTDTFICLLILLFSYLKNNRFSRKQILDFFKTVVLVAFIIVPIGITLFSSQIALVINRFTNLIGNLSIGSENADYSFTVRYLLLYVGIQAFLFNPIFGVGLGGYYKAFDKYIILPTNPYARAELLSCINSPALTSYSFYFTVIAENGLLGFGMIEAVISTLRKPKDEIFRSLSWFVIYMFFQTELYGAPILAIWLAIINSGCFITKETRKDENINNNTLLQ